jgi:hypothetical protein
MKSILVTFSILLTATTLFAQEASIEEIKKNNPFIRIEPSEVNLGSIPSNKVTEELGNVEINLYNDGAKPLILNQVTACCGTRVTEWTREPIPPNGKGTIKVNFRVGTHPHRISRTVTISSNAANGNSHRVSISGEVIIPSDAKEIQLGHSREMD